MQDTLFLSLSPLYRKKVHRRRTKGRKPIKGMLLIGSLNSKRMRKKEKLIPSLSLQG
jgi:hypothetical protein